MMVMDVNFRTLDLNLLRVFDEVMAERSITRAARNLSMTQPAASNSISIVSWQGQPADRQISRRRRRCSAPRAGSAISQISR